MPREVYTHSYHQVVIDAHGSRTAEEAAAFVRQFIQPDMRILDAGCGPGSITCGLAEWVPDGEVIGVDSAATVLDVARERATENRLVNISFEQANVYRLGFSEGSFDVVYAHQLLQHLGKPVEALQEFRRVLKPGGVVAVRDADYGTMTHFPHEAGIDRFFAIYSQVARANGGEPDAGRRLLSWVRTAGFRDAKMTTSSWTYATEDNRSHWANLWAVRTGVSKYVERVEELGVSDREELGELGTRFQDWALNPDAVFAFLHGEVVARV
jgi:ubiquinone/menaquinone biosynthesis C-methylase UbiE